MIMMEVVGVCRRRMLPRVEVEVEVEGRVVGGETVFFHLYQGMGNVEVEEEVVSLHPRRMGVEHTTLIGDDGDEMVMMVMMVMMMWKQCYSEADDEGCWVGRSSLAFL